jgi:hypothetical protein
LIAHCQSDLDINFGVEKVCDLLERPVVEHSPLATSLSQLSISAATTVSPHVLKSLANPPLRWDAEQVVHP